MKPSEIFEAHRDQIRRIVLAHNALNPRVFGSVLNGCDTESSDLEVDVLTPNALPDSFRAQVLAEAKPV